MFYLLTTIQYVFILVIPSKSLHHCHQHPCITLLVYVYFMRFRSTLLSTFLKMTHSGWILVPKYTLELETPGWTLQDRECCSQTGGLFKVILSSHSTVQHSTVQYSTVQSAAVRLKDYYSNYLHSQYSNVQSFVLYSQCSSGYFVMSINKLERKET